MLGSAESFSGQRVNTKIESGRESAESQKSPHVDRKTGLLGFYYTLAICSSDVGECAIRKTNLTAPERLTHKALY